MRKPRIKPPVKPTGILKKHIEHAAYKKYKSVLHRPKRTVTSWKNYLKPSHYNPKGYLKSYYKNITLPIAKPYRKYKAIKSKINKIIKPINRYLKDRENQWEKYDRKVEKYKRSWDKYYQNLADRKEERRKAKEEFKKNFQGFVKKEEVNIGGWNSESSGIAAAYDSWRDQKIGEMKKKWNKAQLFYIPRMDLEGYNAIKTSPERIWAYYKGEAQEIFPTVEKFREFLDDYFSLGGFISKGVSSLMLGKLEKVGTLKQIAKIAKYAKFLL